MPGVWHNPLCSQCKQSLNSPKCRRDCDPEIRSRDQVWYTADYLAWRYFERIKAYCKKLWPNQRN